MCPSSPEPPQHLWATSPPQKCPAPSNKQDDGKKKHCRFYNEAQRSVRGLTQNLVTLSLDKILTTLVIRCLWAPQMRSTI